MLREGNIVSQDIRKGGIAVLAFERGCAEQHLVNQYAEGPPINSTRMPTTLNNLRRNVLLRANKRVRSEVSYT